MTPRMCDGQPGTVDCKFNGADIADRARHMAAETFYEPNYGRPYEVSLNDDMRIQMFDKPSRLNRALDRIGNLPHRFGRWVDRSAAMQTLCLSIGAVIACALAALVVMR